MKAAAPGATYIVTSTVQNTPILEMAVTALDPRALRRAAYAFVRDQLKASLDRLCKTSSEVNTAYRTVFQPIVEPTRADGDRGVGRASGRRHRHPRRRSRHRPRRARRVGRGRPSPASCRQGRAQGRAPNWRRRADGPPPAGPSLRRRRAGRVDGVAPRQPEPVARHVSWRRSPTTTRRGRRAGAATRHPDDAQAEEPRRGASRRQTRRRHADADGAAARQAVTSPSNGAAPRSSSVRNTQ